MSTYGIMTEFNENSTKWSTYRQRLTFFFDANSIESEEKKRATFIAVVGDKTYKTLLGLLAPAVPPGVVFIDIMNKLDKHYHQNPTV